MLAISMGSGTGLARHLGVADLGYEPTELAPGLSAMAIERRRALDEYVHLQLHLPRRAPIGALSRALDGIADTVPGIRDLITIGKVAFEAWSDDWDVVIADAPATGQIGSYLNAPTSIAELVPAGTVRRQAEAMRDLLSAETTRLIVTTSAEELPVTETLETLQSLTEFNVTVIINRMLPELAARDTGSPVAREAADLHRALYRAQQEWRSRLPDGSEVPFLFGLHTPAEVSSRLSEELAL